MAAREEEVYFDNPPPYYSEIGIEAIPRAFRNLDDRVNLEGFERKLRSATTRNFVIDFGDGDDAWCAFDLDAESIEGLLQRDRPGSLNTRWINIWIPHEQQDVLEVLGTHYDFSPRLLGVMSENPPKPYPKSASTRKSIRSMFHRSPHPEHIEKLQNLEKDSANHSSTSSRTSTESDVLRNITHYRIVDEVWHWSSVDWGRQYICLGYNSLYNVDLARIRHLSTQDGTHDRPEGKRVWNWLLLCEDKTVITIHEDPFPYRNGNLDANEQRALLATRRNLMNVFRQLSKAYDEENENPIAILPIRKRVGETYEEDIARSADAPGLLFYCIFDDWFTSYSLVARREHQYAAELNRIREEMLQTASLDNINRLHHLGRQLSVLKLLYQSYELIIDRVLQKQEPSFASLKNSQLLDSPEGREALASSDPAMSIRQLAEARHIGVSLSSGARVRFGRLKDRIRLYALSEINECLELKESLVMMNFNLIAIKESLYVEKLTRITVLLAKVTIVFMPVSLMTAYFSTQLTDMTFTNKEYWISFGVTTILTILALLIFGFVSGTMEGKLVYRSLGRATVDFGRAFLQRRRARSRESAEEDIELN